MRNFLRNPEVRHTVILFASAAAIFTAGGFYFSTSAGIWVLACCIFFTGIYLFTTYRRYQYLRKLSNELDAMLHDGTAIPFSDYTEGELSILQNELSKMTLRLVDQAQTLEKDKICLSDAMADISHQLRSPLTSSQLILSLLNDPHLKPARRSELLMELSQLLSHMGWLVEALLKMSKMDAKTAYLKEETVFLTELIRHACEPLLIPMELRGQRFITNFSTGTEHFTGDLSWSTEAILNVLKNCMEHTPEGGTISVTCRENALFTELCIEDDGSGLFPEDIPHLFERFYKGKDSGSQSVGIGLALARMIITTQNGTIKAENRSEGGARFLIRFYSSIPV